MASTFTLAVLVGLSAIALGLLLYSGLLHSIQIETKKPPMISKVRVAYKFARGSYSEAGPLWDEVSKAAPQNRCFAAYYDSPNTIPAASLRSIVGTILSEGDNKPDEKLEKQLVSQGFKIIEFPEVPEMVQTTFPFVNTLSIYIAVFRVYPALGDYVKANNLCAYPTIELYDKDIIYYLAPTSKQKEFFVPEAGDVCQKICPAPCGQ